MARSVQAYANEYRRQGHRVLVGAPRYPRMPQGHRSFLRDDESHGDGYPEDGVVRFPAVQHFNGSDWSLPIPVPGQLARALANFHPEVVHAHHPFVLGGTALRVSTAWDIPVIFTHHTMYDKYTHYLPGDSQWLKRYVRRLVSGYCNLTDAVIAPSETLAAMLRERKVHTTVQVIPTGVDTDRLGKGDGPGFRTRHGIPATAFVVGHVGRLASEKNLDFLVRSVLVFLAQRADAYFLLAGVGPAVREIRAAFAAVGKLDRLCEVGLLHHGELADAYRAMDCFAFASHTETQGIVVTEAMAAGVPVVAVDASGVREVVVDGYNGRLLPRDEEAAFATALAGIAALPSAELRLLSAAARETATRLDIHHTAAATVDLYQSLIVARVNKGPATLSKRLWREYSIVLNVAHAILGEWCHDRRAR